MYTFSVEAPLKVATKSFLASAGEEKTDLLLPPSLPSTAYRSSRTIKRHSLFKSAPIHNTKWRRSTAPITALCIRNPSRTVTRRRHFVPRSCFPFPSFTLDPRPQKLDETAECRPRARLLLLLLLPLPSSPLPSSRPPSCHLADYYAFLSFRFFDNSPPSRNSSFVRQKYPEEEKGEKGFYHLTKADRLRSKDPSSRSIDYL